MPCLTPRSALLGHSHHKQLLVACGLVIGLVLAFGTALVIVQARHDDITNVERELKNLSLVLAEETDRAFQSMELVQLGLMEHLREQGIDAPEKFDLELSSQSVHQDLQRRITGLPQISALSLVSRGGQVISHSRDWPLPNIDVSDRDYFQALTHDRTQSSFISVPVRNRINGAWTILFTRAFTGPGGQLIGIISTGLELDLFEHLFARIAVGGDPAFSLLRTDGVLLARYPRMDTKIGHAYGETSDFHSLQAALDHQTVMRAGMVSGTPRVIAPHGAAHYPLILSATNTVEAALGPWRRRVRWMAGVATLAELVLAAVVLFGVRQLRGQERVIAANAAAAHAETARELAEIARALAESELALARQREITEHAARLQSQRLDVALSNMLQGLMMVDGTGRVLLINQRFIELFGLPADAGRTITSYADMVKLVVNCGTVTADDMAALRAWRQSAVDTHAKATFNCELADGRTVKVTHQPIDNDWLTTYEDITESRRADLRLAYVTRHDALTDLPNRILFREKLAEAIMHARRGQPLALLSLDLDQFKAVNDTLGHPVGDALLRAVAGRLMTRTRESDTVARLGGDAFAVVQTPINGPLEAVALAERLVGMLDEPFDVEGHHIVIGTSVGIAFAPQDGLDPDDLLKSADLALSRAKQDGRGVYRLFQTEMDAKMQIRRALELDLRNVLRRKELELFYQPLINLSTRSVAGFEALLRWRHPTRGLVPPNQFIPLAEEIGAIVPIGEWTLRRACVAAAAWRGDLKVAVNLSPVQFRHESLVATVAAALRDSGLQPHRLELEITESVMMQDTTSILAMLHGLRALGISVAMDDFGTGYSSLSYLRRFPFDRIKIDQSFIRELGTKQDSGAIVRAITALSYEFGMATTAEGVETLEQLTALVRAGCTDVQGYLFSSPVPEQAIAELLFSMSAIKDILPSGKMAADGRPFVANGLLPAM